MLPVLFLGTTVHADSAARLWRATGMLQQAPTACVPFKDGLLVEFPECPESSGLVHLQASAGEASFLAQISRHGGPTWFGLNGQAITHALEQVRQLKQPLHALKLANREFAVLARRAADRAATRRRATVVGWRSQFPNCNTLLQPLAVASVTTLVFTACESYSARRVAVIDAMTGTLNRWINLADFPYRLGATASHLGWLVYDPATRNCACALPN